MHVAPLSPPGVRYELPSELQLGGHHMHRGDGAAYREGRAGGAAVQLAAELGGIVELG